MSYCGPSRRETVLPAISEESPDPVVSVAIISDSESDSGLAVAVFLSILSLGGGDWEGTVSLSNLKARSRNK